MGRRAGRTTLTAKGPGPGLVATWQVRVIAAGLKLSTTRVGLPLARRYSLKASFADETGTPIGPATGVTWTSDNPAVAPVAEDGTVSTAGYGHARVTATAPGGKHAGRGGRDARVAVAGGRHRPVLGDGGHRGIVGCPRDTRRRPDRRPRLVGEAGLEAVASRERQAHPRRRQLQTRGDHPDLPRRDEPRAGTLRRQRRPPGPPPHQRSGRGVKGRERRIRHGPADRRDRKSTRL